MKDYAESLVDEWAPPSLDRPQGKGYLDIDTPRIFTPLLSPARYKAIRGGRGGGKSWLVAGRLLEDCYDSHQRIVCTREYQVSIKDSVKALLDATIIKYGMEDEFRSTETEIVGPNESLFIFRGLNTPSTGRSGTAQSIRSLEGFSRCWVEEAHTISRRSLEVLTPTFRVKGAELWFTWNPMKPDDPVEAMFNEAIAQNDPNFICVTCNYYNNPWFPGELRVDMERDKRRDPDVYAHVWLGEYLRRSGDRVFTNWEIAEFETPPRTRFYFGADWGFSIDPSVLVRCWIDREKRRLYIDQEAYEVGCPIDRLPTLFTGVPYSKQYRILADSARPETIDYMKRHGFPKMEPAMKGKNSVEDGIEFMQSFDIVVHPRCEHAINEMSRYAWKRDPRTDEILPELADKENHVIDSIRYAISGERRARGPVITPEMLAKSMLPGVPPRRTGPVFSQGGKQRPFGGIVRPRRTFVG